MTQQTIEDLIDIVVGAAHEAGYSYDEFETAVTVLAVGMLNTGSELNFEDEDTMYSLHCNTLPHDTVIH